MMDPSALIIGGGTLLVLTTAWALHLTGRAQDRSRHWRTIARRKKPGPDRRADERAHIRSTMNLIRASRGLPEFHA